MKSVAATLLLLAVALGIATAHPVRMQRVISTLRSSVLAQTSQPICDNIYCDVPSCQGTSAAMFDPAISCCPFCPIYGPPPKTCQELVPGFEGCCSSSPPYYASTCYASGGYCFCDQECYHYGDCCEDILDIGCRSPQEPSQENPEQVDQVPYEQGPPARAELDATLQHIAEYQMYNRAHN